METLLKHAMLAWNPIGATRTRLQEGNLTVGSVLLPFLGVVIACNLLAVTAQMFFWESVAFGLGRQLPEHPLLGDFPQRFFSALGPVVPAAVVALLPAQVFGPAGRSATVASIFVIAAGWAFYGAAVTVPIFFLAGVLATADPEAGLSVANLLSIPATLLVVGLTIWFWVRVLCGVLELTWGAFALITVCTVGSVAAVAALVLAVLSA